MVESTQSNAKGGQEEGEGVHGILKNVHEAGGGKGVRFDEQEIAAYDKTRGQCQKIDDPKTPYHEYEDDEMTNENAGGEDAVVDPEVLEHLQEAQQNRELNAK